MGIRIPCLLKKYIFNIGSLPQSAVYRHNSSYLPLQCSRRGKLQLSVRPGYTRGTIMRLKPFRTQCPPRHYAVWSYFSFNLSLCDCRFRVFGAAGKPRIGRFFMTIFVILFFACIITPSLTLSQRRNNKELAAHELDGRRLVIRKRCPPPKCCNVVEHVSRTRVSKIR